MPKNIHLHALLLLYFQKKKFYCRVNKSEFVCDFLLYTCVYENSSTMIYEGLVRRIFIRTKPNLSAVVSWTVRFTADYHHEIGFLQPHRYHCAWRKRYVIRVTGLNISTHRFTIKRSLVKTNIFMINRTMTRLSSFIQ